MFYIIYLYNLYINYLNFYFQEKKEQVKICFICHKIVSVNIEPWRHLRNDFTSSTFVQLSDLICDIMAETNKQIKLKKTAVVCMSCFELLDRVDQLQEQLKVSIFYLFIIISKITVNFKDFLHYFKQMHHQY